MAGAVFSYQWVRSRDGADADIAGATTSVYTLTDADKNSAVKVRVGFTDDIGYHETLTSEPAAQVANRPNTPAEVRPVPVWSATMTAGAANNANGYNIGAGRLTGASFDLGGTVHTFIEILAWEFMYITVDTALPEGFALEVNGEQFALADADAVTYNYGTVYYWEDAGQTWPQGSRVSLALYPAD